MTRLIYYTGKNFFFIENYSQIVKRHVTCVNNKIHKCRNLIDLMIYGQLATCLVSRKVKTVSSKTMWEVDIDGKSMGKRYSKRKNIVLSKPRLFCTSENFRLVDYYLILD